MQGVLDTGRDRLFAPEGPVFFRNGHRPEQGDTEGQGRPGRGEKPMATQKQINFILALYEKLGQEPEDDIEELSTKEAHSRIKELLAMKGDVGR